MPEGSAQDGGFDTDSGAYFFDNLVSLSVKNLANRVDRVVPIGLHLEVDSWTIEIPRRTSLFGQLIGSGSPTPLRLRVRLRYCHVRYDTDGCEVEGHTKYVCFVTPGAYTWKTQRRASRETERSLGGSLSLDINAAVTQPVSASGSAKGSAAKNLKSSLKNEDTAEVTYEIAEVQVIPKGWRIGDEQMGDPTKIGGYLDGAYFRREVEGYPQTCIILLDANRKTAKIAFSITAYDGIRVERLDGSNGQGPDRLSTIERMKNRIAAITLEKNISKPQRLSDELHLGRVVCKMTRATENDE